MNKKIIYSSLMAFMLLSGCGSDIKNGTFNLSNSEGNLTGTFIDSEVEGVKYITSSGVEGYTNSKGEYKYNDGDEVDFFVNNLKLGSTKAQELTTVFDLDYPEKVALLLQSIDTDGNPNNGIQLSEDTTKKFQNANFTIDEVNPESKEFIKKYNILTGRDITLDSTIANNHAISSLKEVIIDNVSDKFFDAIRLNNYDFTVLDTNKNGKDYIHSLRAKIRTFLVIEPVATTLNSTSKLLHLQSQGIMYDAKEFQKEVENITDTFTKVVSIGGIVTNGYKNLKELTRIKTAFSATTGYVNDAKFWKEFTDLTKNITLSEAQGQALKTGFFSVSDDPETEKKISDCYGALVPDGFGQVQCFGRLAGEIFYNANNVVEGIKGLSLELKRASIDISYQYLKLYYFLDAENNPQVLANALTEISNNKLSKSDAKKYQFLSFDPLNDKDLEKALDLFSIVLGYAVYDPILDNVFAYNYYYDYAKKTILDKQNFIENTTEFYMSSFDKSLLYDIDSEYLDIDIQIEPSDNQDYYKACVNVDNISSVYLKEIKGKLNLYLDSNLIKIDNLFVGDLAHTTNTFAQRCSEDFPLIFKEKVLSLGIIKAEYSFKYLPNTHDVIEKEREQIGSKYFEINKHSFAEDVAMPIIKLDIPKFIKPNEQIKLDASKTVSLLKDDTFTYKWEYLTTSNEEDIDLTNGSSDIAYIKAYEVPSELAFQRHDFKLTVTSNTNGRESIKEFSIFVKNDKPTITKLEAPTLNSSIKINDEKATLTWNQVENATSYKVYVSDKKGVSSSKNIASYPSVKTTITIPNIKKGKKYYVVVEAKNISKKLVSSLSNEIEVYEKEEAVTTPTNTTTPIDVSTLTLQDCKDKTLNQTFQTNTWTTSLDEWNSVHIACVKIFSDNESGNIPTTDTPTNSSRTSVEYMKNHKTEKLASTDCKVRNYKNWEKAKNELIYSLAPADNMMKSIEGCIDVVKLTELGGLSFSKAVESVVRSRTKETSPFSDIWDKSATTNNTDNLNVNDVAQHQNDFEAYSAEIKKNTIATCKEKYGRYSFMELSIFANTPTSVDTAVGQTMNGDASYCLTLLTQSGDLQVNENNLITNKYIVVDNQTKLMWQDSPDNQYIQKIWLTEEAYHECKGDDNSKTCYDTSGDTASTYCSELSLEGYSDWRLPTANELKSIIDITKNSQPYINNSFKYVGINDIYKNSIYWSSDTDTDDSSYVSYARDVDFSINTDMLDSSEKWGLDFVRCVRGI